VAHVRTRYSKCHECIQQRRLDSVLFTAAPTVLPKQCIVPSSRNKTSIHFSSVSEMNLKRDEFYITKSTMQSAPTATCTKRTPFKHPLYIFVSHTVHVLTITLSPKVRTLWYTIYDTYQLPQVSAPRCHPQGVVITTMYMTTCQSRWRSSL